MQFYVMTRTHVRRFTFVHVAKCHSTILWKISSCFPITGFKATVCASKEDNWYNWAPTRWGQWIVWICLKRLHQKSLKSLHQASLNFKSSDIELYTVSNIVPVGNDISYVWNKLLNSNMYNRRMKNFLVQNDLNILEIDTYKLNSKQTWCVIQLTNKYTNVRHVKTTKA